MKFAAQKWNRLQWGLNIRSLTSKVTQEFFFWYVVLRSVGIGIAGNLWFFLRSLSSGLMQMTYGFCRVPGQILWKTRSCEWHCGIVGYCQAVRIAGVHGHVGSLMALWKIGRLFLILSNILLSFWRPFIHGFFKTIQ
jgi:hypothetical protein